MYEKLLYDMFSILGQIQQKVEISTDLDNGTLTLRNIGVRKTDFRFITKTPSLIPYTLHLYSADQIYTSVAGTSLFIVNTSCNSDNDTIIVIIINIEHSHLQDIIRSMSTDFPIYIQLHTNRWVLLNVKPYLPESSYQEYYCYLNNTHVADYFTYLYIQYVYIYRYIFINV